MWMLYSLIASILWGIDYTLTERVLQHVRLPTLLTLELFFGFVTMLGITLTSGGFKADLPAIVSSKQTALLVILIIIVFNVANAFIVLSIGSRNATLAGLIEISYPLFIVLFSWWFFDETTLNVGTAIGGGLIFLGVASVYFFNR